MFRLVLVYLSFISYLKSSTFNILPIFFSLIYILQVEPNVTTTYDSTTAAPSQSNIPSSNHNPSDDNGQQNPVTSSTNTAGSAAVSRDVTCKPKPIKAHRHTDNAILSYQQIPIYAFNSPKNPTGISPFQPTGTTDFLTVFKNLRNSFFFNFRILNFRL